MKLSHQPPAYSPISLTAVTAGWAALLRREAEPSALISLLRERFGADEVLLTDSGMSALALAIRGALATEPAASVALPAYGCYDLASATVASGRSALLYDLDPRTLGPDLDSLRIALEQGARAVVVAHLYGFPVDVEEVQRLCREFGVLLVEDAAQGSGGLLTGRALGSLAPLSVLSFGRGKGMTGGGGGAVLCRGAGGKGALAAIRGQVEPAGRGVREAIGLSAQWLLSEPALYGIPASLPFLGLGQTVYHHPRAPRHASAVPKRVVPVTMQLAGEEVRTRRQNAERILEGLRLAPDFECVAPIPSAEPGYLRLPALVRRGTGRERVIAAARRLGVMPGYPRPLLELEELRSHCRNVHLPAPGARFLADRLLTFPTHSRLRDRDLQALDLWIRSAGGLRPHGEHTHLAPEAGALQSTSVTS